MKIIGKALKSILVVSLILTMFNGCEMRVIKDIKDGGKTKDAKEYKVDERKELEKDQINTINNLIINTSVADINLIVEDRESVEIHFYGEVETNNKETIPISTIGVEDKSIYITVESKSKFGKSNYNSNNLKLDVYIPKEYKKELEIVAGVGNLKADNLELKKMTFNIGVGNIKIKEYIGEIVGETGVGDINIEFNNLENDISLNSGTGNVKINLPENAEFYINAETGVGDIDNDFKLRVNDKSVSEKMIGTVGSDKNKIELKTGVGDIEVSN